MKLALRVLKMVLLCSLTMLCLISCSPRPSRDVGRSFYYWKSDFRLCRSEVAVLQKLQVTTLYLKFFDVVWGGAGPAPASPLRFDNPPPSFIRVIPCVFITNETLTNLPPGRIPELAANICAKIDRMVKSQPLRPIAEVQLDCDWTLGTRDKYFRLIREIRFRYARRAVRLSATIRLHQIKYRQLTGIPPADRGMLMFYNLTPVKEFATANSILNLAVGKTYTADLKTYPLPLDVALPLFSWGVIFQDDHFIGLANDFSRAELRARARARNPYFEVYEPPDGGKGQQPSTPCYFRVIHDIYLHQTQLYRGDLIRVEESDYPALRECALYLTRQLSPQQAGLNVAFFHFDKINLRRIGDGQITALFDCFR